MKHKYFFSNSESKICRFIFYFSFLTILLHSGKVQSQGADCLNATILTVNGAAVGGTISDAVINDPTIATGCSGGSTSRDGWYKFVATSSIATVTVTSTNRQLVIYAYSGACVSLTQFNCSNTNTTAGPQTEVMNLTGLVATNTYYIRVVNSANNIMNLSAVTVTTSQCDTAVSLPCGTTNLAGTTVGTTNIPHGLGCSISNYGKWYTFVGNGQVTTISSTASFDHEMSISSGSCGSFTSIDCVDNSTAGETYTFTSVNGTTYYVYLAHYLSGSTTTGTFTISRSCVVPPTNDDCSTSVGLTVNPTATCTTSTNGNTSGATQSSTSCDGNSDDDVWYHFTATSTNHVVTVTPNTLNNAVFQVYSGNCGGLTNIACVNTTTGSSVETTTLSGLTIGNTYYVRVHSNANTIGSQGSFAICVTTLPNCTAPSSQATGFTTGSVTSSTFPATFSGTASGYLVILSTSSTPPTSPSNGTIYDATNIATLGSGLTFVQSSNSTSITTSGLNGNTRYYYYIYAYNNSSCIGGPIYHLSAPLSGNAVACPVAPSPVSTTATLTSINFSWPTSIGGGANAVTYTLQVTTDAGYTSNVVGSPFTISNPTTSYNLAGLTGNTIYYYRIRASNGCNSTYTQGSTTTGYCSATSYYTGEYIDSFSTTGGVANITNNSTGFSTSGYGDFTGMTVSQLPYGTINFSADFYYDYYGFSIWVDWNNDLDFDDAGERVYTSAGTVLDATGSFAVSSSALPGNYRMRIRIDYDDSSPESCGEISFGETEDYTLTILSLPCSGNPSAITASSLTTTTATVSWTAASPAPANGYDYYLSTSATIPTAGTTPTGDTAAGVTSVNLTSLVAGTNYFIWVRSDCGGATGQGIWIPYTFSTLIAPPITTGATICQGASTIISATASCAASTNLGNTINGSWNAATDPIALQPLIFISSEDPCAFDTETANYTTLNFQVSVSGTYVFAMADTSAYDGMGYIVTGGFTPGSCATGTWIAGDDDGGATSLESEISANLTAGVTYTLITTVYSFSNTTITNNYTWNITGPGTLASGTNGILQWYTSASGGTPIGTGTPFNPVGVSGSGLSNTNTPGTYTFYAACSAYPSIRTAANIVIQGPTAVISGAGSICDTSTTISVALTGNQPWSVTYTDGTTPTTVSGITATPYTFTVSPTTTTSYTLTATSDSNCPAVAANVSGSAIVSYGKTWLGGSSDWNATSNWSGGTLPNATDCVVIPDTANDPIVSGTGYNGLAGSLTVLDGAVLTINSNNSITVTDWVNIQANGTFLINNNASLVQINNNANTGNIVYRRNAFVRSLDYVYWSSPVAGFNVSNIASPLTSWGIYKWNTIVTNPNGGQGNWENAAGNTMIPGKGYIASGPSSFSSSTAATLNGVFTGVPNNGNITVAIERGNDTNTGLHYGTNGVQITNYSDNWNLLGNPYPSAIRGSQFLFDNNTKLMGNIRLWTHGTLPAAIANPFYDSFVYNYSPGDYLTYNFTGTSCCPTAAADLFIGSGQGFFVQMIDGTAGSDTVTFTNNLRSATYSNSSFYRFSSSATNSSSGNNVENLERNRIWLDIISATGQSERTLFGYIQEATMDEDNFFDCKTQNTGSTQIYSLIDDSLYSIQGRSLPFNIYDEVPIGVNIPNSGIYTIALAAIDGLFNEQDIYLKDNLLNITHNLKASPYQFSASNGLIKDRFKVVYLNNTLGNPEFSTDNNVRVVIKDVVSVSSNNLQMESIIVYNLLGQKLDTYPNINTNYFTLFNLRKNNAGLLLKIKLQTGETVIRKVVY